MASFLMCPPTYFDVDYIINPWMENNVHKVDKSLAQKQWDCLYEVIGKLATVHLIDPIKNLPDMVFTANAGLPYKPNKSLKKFFMLSRFRSWHRTPEEDYFEQWAMKNGYVVVVPKPDMFFEGAGDCLVDSVGKYWLGFGFRTNQVAENEVAKLVNENMYSLKLTDPRFYHLDTCFCPLSNGYLLYNPQAFDNVSRELILYYFGDKALASYHPEMFECNSVCIENVIISPKISLDTKHVLEQAGFDIIQNDLSEFIKSGGSAKCLTLRIIEDDQT